MKVKKVIKHLYPWQQIRIEDAFGNWWVNTKVEKESDWKAYADYKVTKMYPGYFNQESCIVIYVKEERE